MLATSFLKVDFILPFFLYKKSAYLYLKVHLMTLREAHEHMDLGTTLGKQREKYRFDYQIERSGSMMFGIRDNDRNTKPKDSLIHHILIESEDARKNRFIDQFIYRCENPKGFKPIIPDWDIRIYVHGNGNIELQKFNTQFNLTESQVQDKVIIALTDMPKEYQAFYAKYVLMR